ncbi:hypothetical protein F4804DRAFT_313477, partial [Jackrogersella minutella]
VPRKEQVDAVYDLVFNEIDLVFIAKTSFGKSLIIQAFSLITDRIPIQIAPLVKLGEEQRDSVLKPRCVPVDNKNDPGVFGRRLPLILDTSHTIIVNIIYVKPRSLLSWV